MKKRCCARCCISLLFLMLFLIPCASCAAGISCEIIPADSSWIPGESALFEGIVNGIVMCGGKIESIYGI